MNMEVSSLPDAPAFTEETVPHACASHFPKRRLGSSLNRLDKVEQFIPRGDDRNRLFHPHAQESPCHRHLRNLKIF